jgi:hypothetical protein
VHGWHAAFLRVEGDSRTRHRPLDRERPLVPDNDWGITVRFDRLADQVAIPWYRPCSGQSAADPTDVRSQACSRREAAACPSVSSRVATPPPSKSRWRASKSDAAKQRQGRSCLAIAPCHAKAAYMPFPGFGQCLSVAGSGRCRLLAGASAAGRQNRPAFQGPERQPSRRLGSCMARDGGRLQRRPPAVSRAARGWPGVTLWPPIHR